ncbi:MAG: glycosyltransferase [Fidelibacterota bacterium]|nr:MAG: glycosyltransferase [Candidatus Neomarinimicrobiota bacterium]
MRILTLNSHQPYIYDLAQISGIELLVVDRIPGRERDKWDEAVRPLPDNAQLLALNTALARPPACDVFVAHNLTDLSMIKTLSLPSVLMIHSSLDRLLTTQETSYSREDIHRILQAYITLKHVVVTAVSTMKANSWGITDCPIVPFYTDTDFFQGYHGSNPQGLRVTNHLVEKGAALNLEFFSSLIEGIDVRVVGLNPRLGTQPAASREELLQLYQSQRYYIHTAVEDMEDGYNMASLEAMATGMPIVCNQHSTAPITDGKNGFMASDLAYLREKIHSLEENLDLAMQLGSEARKYVLENHSRAQFESKWRDILDLAIDRFKQETPFQPS